MAQNKTLDPIANAMLKEYEDALTPKKPVVKSTFDLKNYFSTYLPEGVKTGTKQIRILPSQSNGNPFDSFPYNIKLSDYWNEKEEKYKTVNDDKEEEYTLTQDDIDNEYNESNIKSTFDDDFNNQF